MLRTRLSLIYILGQFISKEVIHLQVPLQIPCYDLAPLAEPKLDIPNKERLTKTQLGWLDGRCVQGAGAYSPRNVDPRLLRIPTS